MTFRRLIEHNEWYVPFYQWEGDERSYRNRIPLEAMTIRVRWPEGAVTRESLTYKPKHVDYEDHGHACTALGHVFGFNVRHRGAKMWVPITEVEVCVEDVSPKAPSDSAVR